MPLDFGKGPGNFLTNFLAPFITAGANQAQTQLMLKQQRKQQEAERQREFMEQLKLLAARVGAPTETITTNILEPEQRRPATSQEILGRIGEITSKERAFEQDIASRRMSTEEARLEWERQKSSQAAPGKDMDVDFRMKMLTKWSNDPDVAAQIGRMGNPTEIARDVPKYNKLADYVAQKDADMSAKEQIEAQQKIDRGALSEFARYQMQADRDLDQSIKRWDSGLQKKTIEEAIRYGTAAKEKIRNAQAILNKIERLSALDPSTYIFGPGFGKGWLSEIAAGIGPLANNLEIITLTRELATELEIFSATPRHELFAGSLTLGEAGKALLQFPETSLSPIIIKQGLEQLLPEIERKMQQNIDLRNEIESSIYDGREVDISFYKNVVSPETYQKMIQMQSKRVTPQQETPRRKPVEDMTLEEIEAEIESIERERKNNASVQQ